MRRARGDSRSSPRPKERVRRAHHEVRQSIGADGGSNPKIGRAEALRQAMLGYLNDASSPRNAYPALSGPFALIGEGAAR
jgi:hypothetical protein